MVNHGYPRKTGDGDSPLSVSPIKIAPGVPSWCVRCNWVITEHLPFLFQFVFLFWEDFTRISKTEMSHSHHPLLKKNW